MKRSPNMLCALALLAGLFAAGAVGAQPEALPELIDRLVSDDFVERELATRTIESDPAITLGDIEAALVRGNLHLEQRRRLIVSCRRRFFAEPRAAMGIMLGSETNLGLRITGTTPGFDADGKLQADDIIVDIAGTPIRATEDLQVSIISRSPGDVVPVTVIRGDEQTLVVELELGAWSQLGQNPTPRFDVMELSWQHRFGDALAEGAPPRLGLLAGPDEPAAGPQGAGGRGVSRPVIVGGEPRVAAGRAAGVRLDRPLTRRDRSSPTSYAERITEKLAELQVQRGETLERIRQADERLEFAIRTGNERRRQDAEQLKTQHEEALLSQTAEIARLRRELELIRGR